MDLIELEDLLGHLRCEVHRIDEAIHALEQMAFRRNSSAGELPRFRRAVAQPQARGAWSKHRSDSDL